MLSTLPSVASGTALSAIDTAGSRAAAPPGDGFASLMQQQAELHDAAPHTAADDTPVAVGSTAQTSPAAAGAQDAAAEGSPPDDPGAAAAADLPAAAPTDLPGDLPGAGCHPLRGPLASRRRAAGDAAGSDGTAADATSSGTRRAGDPTDESRPVMAAQVADAKAAAADSAPDPSLLPTWLHGQALVTGWRPRLPATPVSTPASGAARAAGRVIADAAGSAGRDAAATAAHGPAPARPAAKPGIGAAVVAASPDAPVAGLSASDTGKPAAAGRHRSAVADETASDKSTATAAEQQPQTATAVPALPLAPASTVEGAATAIAAARPAPGFTAAGAQSRPTAARAAVDGDAAPNAAAMAGMLRTGSLTAQATAGTADGADGAAGVDASQGTGAHGVALSGAPAGRAKSAGPEVGADATAPAKTAAGDRPVLPGPADRSEPHHRAEATGTAQTSPPAAAGAANAALAASPVTAPATAEAQIRAPLDSAAFGPALGAQISVFARDGVQTAQLQLNPVEMGPITVLIALDGSAAKVDFQADLASTRAAIEASLPALAGALQDAGMTLAGGGVSQQHSGQRPPADADPGAGAGRSTQGGRAALAPLPVASAPLRSRGLVDLVA